MCTADFSTISKQHIRLNILPGCYFSVPGTDKQKLIMTPSDIYTYYYTPYFRCYGLTFLQTPDPNLNVSNPIYNRDIFEATAPFQTNINLSFIFYNVTKVQISFFFNRYTSSETWQETPFWVVKNNEKLSSRIPEVLSLLFWGNAIP